MKNKSYKFLTVFLLIGFMVGTLIGILIWTSMHNVFSIPIGAGLGMLIGIVIGTTIDYRKQTAMKSTLVRFCKALNCDIGI